MIYQLTEQSLTELTELKKNKELENKTLNLLKEKFLERKFKDRNLFVAELKNCLNDSRDEKIILIFLERKAFRSALLNWWGQLEEIKFPDGTKVKSNRGERAKLRRCTKPEDVLLQPYFFELQQQLPDNLSPLAIAAIAGLLAHIEKQPEKRPDGDFISFPRQLGQGKENSDKPIFSELRFQQLLASRDIDELYDNCRRAIMQLNRTANVISLADGVLQWFKEQHEKNQFDERPEQRFQFTWAKAYYSKQ